jgi:TrmH family RNA methyltransferase
MLSTAEIKQLRSYHLKKFRDEVGVFIAETPKVVETLLTAGMEPVQIYAVEATNWEKSLNIDLKILEISEKELERISNLIAPNDIFAVFKIPIRTLQLDTALKGISLVLDDIRDPGNMGTILRIADWFGIDRIIASKESADAFQPKCVQASMGSVGNVPVFYEDLPTLMQKLPKDFNLYGTFMDGENIYTTPLEKQNLWFVTGNEAHGISAGVAEHIREKISIPSFNGNDGRIAVAESLNAAMATAVVCSELKRS